MGEKPNAKLFQPATNSMFQFPSFNSPKSKINKIEEDSSSLKDPSINVDGGQFNQKITKNFITKEPEEPQERVHDDNQKESSRVVKLFNKLNFFTPSNEP